MTERPPKNIVASIHQRLLFNDWRKKPGPNECPNCGYDLRGSTSTLCPECSHNPLRQPAT